MKKLLCLALIILLVGTAALAAGAPHLNENLV